MLIVLFQNYTIGAGEISDQVHTAGRRKTKDQDQKAVYEEHHSFTFVSFCNPK